MVVVLYEGQRRQEDLAGKRLGSLWILLKVLLNDDDNLLKQLLIESYSHTHASDDLVYVAEEDRRGSGLPDFIRPFFSTVLAVTRSGLHGLGIGR